MMRDKLYIIKFSIAMLVVLGCNIALANNGSYITLSNQIARNTQLNVISNNIANANTTGYEADQVLFKSLDTKQPRNQISSFVYVDTLYRSKESAPLHATNRNLDLAIAGNGYFKILMPDSDKYTLNGAIFINNEYILVNSAGLPFASKGNQPITIPIDTIDLTIVQDGTIYADGEAIDSIGVFDITDANNLTKEGNNLYGGKVRDTVLDDAVIISGHLRGSNVSSTKSMVDMLELQRSVSATNNLMSGIADLEKSVILKVTK